MGPTDEAVPHCAVYTPAKDTFALLNEFEWFWQESNCDRQYPALCEIDLRETGCQAFGFGAIETPKWKHPDYDDCTVFEWCKNDADGNPVIQMGQCGENRVFDETLAKPRCVPKEQVPHCDIDECATGEFNRKLNSLSRQFSVNSGAREQFSPPNYSLQSAV